MNVEKMAAAEHRSWSGWTRWMLGQIEKQIEEAKDDQVGTIWDDTCTDALRIFQGLPCVERWQRQMVTDYADLSEKEKESDRTEARWKIKAYGADEIHAVLSECLLHFMHHGNQQGGLQDKIRAVMPLVGEALVVED